MFTVERPEAFNVTWARAFNTRELANLLALYEDDAILADATRTVRGKGEIASFLGEFLKVPGTLSGRNNFCLQLGDLALLRADWVLRDPDGNPIISGSSAEIIRRQPEGNWLYAIDHAAGASLPAV
jgi:ketosteroid isomerase-like protein